MLMLLHLALIVAAACCLIFSHLLCFIQSVFLLLILSCFRFVSHYTAKPVNLHYLNNLSKRSNERANEQRAQNTNKRKKWEDMLYHFSQWNWDSYSCVSSLLYKSCTFCLGFLLACNAKSTKIVCNLLQCFTQKCVIEANTWCGLKLNIGFIVKCICIGWHSTLKSTHSTLAHTQHYTHMFKRYLCLCGVCYQKWAKSNDIWNEYFSIFETDK